LCHGPLSLPTNEDVNAVLAMQALEPRSGYYAPLL